MGAQQDSMGGLTESEVQGEKRYLDRVMGAIISEVSHLSQFVRDDPFDEVREVWKYIRRDQRRQMLSSQSDPYFARIEFGPIESDETVSYYIGKCRIPNESGGDPLVIDWRAPVASLFYQPSRPNVAYNTPAGTVQGILRLKRRIDISGGQIQSITDLFRFSGTVPQLPPESRQPFQPPTIDQLEAQVNDHDASVLRVAKASRRTDDPERQVDEYLLKVLSGPHGRSLRDIVATIQSEQDKLIRSPLEGSLLVQGVAGSGKTSVALHRVAYLLYAYRDMPQQLRASRVVVIGPSRLFAKYTGTVLPDLGTWRLRQTTFDDWMADTKLTSELQILREDATLETILDTRVERSKRARLFRACRAKGSVGMSVILERWVSELRERVEDALVADTSPWLTLHTSTLSRLRGILSSTALASPVTVNRSEISDLYSRTRRIELNSARRVFVEQVVQSFWKKLRSRTPIFAVSGEGDFRNFSRVVNSEVQRLVDSRWPEFALEGAYGELLSDERRLRRIADGIVSLSDILAMVDSADNSTVRLEDLGAICYLSLLLNGRGGISYDHIVVDEVQDLSPLQIKLLRRYVRRGSMTLVGDLAQSVNLHRGIRSWEELEDVFSDGSLRVEALERSYRSTVEIIRFANRILDRFPVSIPQRAHPIDRHGPPVEFCRCHDETTHLKSILQTVQTWQAHGFPTIAVITKTTTRAHKLLHELQGTGLTITEIISRGADIETISDGVFVLPGYLAKGLEFDAVIATDVDAATYTTNELDVRLLYVAVTRALHALTLCWIDSRSKAVPDV